MGVILCHGLQGFSRSAEGPSTGAGPAGAASSKGGAIQARPRAHGLLRRAYLPRRQGDEGAWRCPLTGSWGPGTGGKLKGEILKAVAGAEAHLVAATLLPLVAGFSRWRLAY